MALHGKGVDAVAELHRQAEHFDIRWQRWQLEMAIEQGAHRLAQLHVVLTVGQGDFGQAVAGEDQLAGGGVPCVDRQHALLDDA
ncbi:hypothetical protein D3C80_1449660 [compost metagenome]